MAKITLFAQIIQKIPRDLIQSIVSQINLRESTQIYLGHYWFSIQFFTSFTQYSILSRIW